MKICGLTRREDVESAVEAGADYLGFVLVPESKRYVPPERWRSLTEGVPERVKCVAVVADPAREEVAERWNIFDISQFHGSETTELSG